MKHERHGCFRYCQSCDYKNRNANSLSMHVSRKHSTIMNHFCHICPESFPTQTQLGHHLVNKHSVATISCQNSLCTLKFKNSTTHKTHFVRCHMDKKLLYCKTMSGRCKCLTCGDIFSLNAIIYHVSGCSSLSPFSKSNIAPEQVAPEAEQQSCRFCPISFPTLQQLAHHVVSQHPDTKTLKCVDLSCALVFKNKTAQKTHYMRTHVDSTLLYSKLADKSCKCISCENVFTANAIAYHVSGCSNLSPFSSNNLLCQIIPMREMVLNMEDEEIRNGILQDGNVGELSFGELEDIPTEILDELISDLGDISPILFY